MHSPLAAALRTDRRQPGFDITLPPKASRLFMSIRRTIPECAGDLAADIGRVMGTDASMVTKLRSLSSRVILIGSLDNSPLIDRLIAIGMLVVTDIKNKREAVVVQAGASGALFGRAG